MSFINYINAPMNHSIARRPRLCAVRRIATLAATWFARMNQRRTLATLDDRLLADIGVDARSAGREARKPFWQA